MMRGHGIIGRRRAAAAIALLVSMIALTIPSSARAGEPEGIHLTVDAPPRCVAKEALVAQIEALGAHSRIARRDEWVRAFAVMIAPEGERYRARLVVRDRTGDSTERTVVGRDCNEAAKSAALLVALALDDAEAPPTEPADAPPPSSGTPRSPGPLFWPAPASDDSPTGGVQILRLPRHRRGSGGVVASASLGAGNGVRNGARVYGAARISESTRIGASVALSSLQGRENFADRTLYQTNGWLGRAGAIIGWGAPWNDAVVGFVGEVGLAVTRVHGTASPQMGASQWSSSSLCSSECFDTARRTSTSSVSVTPYVAPSLVLQIPWKASLRPVLGVTTLAVLGSGQAFTMAVMGDVGLVWQAW